ncbi:hypothetical protein GF312_20875 [Candidatus Poribacteria bacterium]|nr:hypothetical protein [Candidatus Poribacteria bacterium]
MIGKKVKLLITVIVITMMLASLAAADIAVIFDEDENDEAGDGDFANVFPNHDAGSTVTVTDDDSISGRFSVFCTPSQSYNNAIAGWAYPISNDDYRYITFAWRKDGGTGIMIQLAFDTTWAYRYFSGVNVTNWPGIQLENDIPEDWMVYTRDLVEDFGANWNLTGVALTPWDGVGGYYDHIILHTDEDEGKIGQFAVEFSGKLTTTWGKIKH